MTKRATLAKVAAAVFVHTNGVGRSFVTSI
jgi:hypothetical protein